LFILMSFLMSEKRKENLEKFLIVGNVAED
jgi:hypothetical protein